MIRPISLGAAGAWPWQASAYASAGPWLDRVCSGTATRPWVLPLGGGDPGEAADRIEALFRQA
ncbi:MAG: hypothetical protein KC613_10155, partial [Myxococcales bacterium]|nr:hypothetical protein [Myxococcales bacterium]